MSAVTDRIEKASDHIVDEMNEPLMDIMVEVFERLRSAGYYADDAQGPDHETELRQIMTKLVEKF